MSKYKRLLFCLGVGTMKKKKASIRVDKFIGTFKRYGTIYDCGNFVKAILLTDIRDSCNEKIVDSLWINIEHCSKVKDLKNKDKIGFKGELYKRSREEIEGSRMLHTNVNDYNICKISSINKRSV